MAADREQAIATLEAALKDPAQAANHERYRTALAAARVPAGAAPPEIAARRTGLAEQQARTHQPGEGVQQYDPRADPRKASDPSAQEQQVARQFNESVGVIGRGAKALGKNVYEEVKSLPASAASIVKGKGRANYLSKHPEAERQLIRGMDDMATLGYGRKLADKLHEMQGHGRPLAESEERDAQVAPDERTGGSMAMMLNPFSLTNVTGRAGIAGAGKLMSRFPIRSQVGGVMKGGAQALIGHELTAPAMAGLHADSAGDRLGTAGRAATDPLSLFITGTTGAMGGGAKGKAAQIRDPKGESGRIIRTIEEGEGRIKKFGEPVEGGIFDDPELQSVSRGQKGTGELAERAITRVDQGNAGKISDARQRFGEAIDEVIMKHTDAPHPTNNAYAALDEMADRVTMKAGRPDAVIADKTTLDTIKHIRSMLTQTSDEVDEAATLAAMMDKLGMKADTKLTPAARKALLAGVGPEDAVRQKAPLVTAEDMIKTRRFVRSMANNAPTASERSVYQGVIKAMDEDAALIDPRIKQMNAEFSSSMVPVEKSDEIIFGKKDRRNNPDVSEAQRRTGLANMMRMGEDTRAGIVRDPANQRLEALGPEYAREAKLMKAKTAQESIRRGDPEVSTALPKTLRRMGAGMRGATMAGAAGGTFMGGSPLWTAIGMGAGYGIDKFNENALANKIRLTLPAAEAAGRRFTGSSGPGVDLLGQIARNRGKKKRDKDKQPAP